MTEKPMLKEQLSEQMEGVSKSVQMLETMLADRRESQEKLQRLTLDFQKANEAHQTAIEERDARLAVLEATVEKQAIHLGTARTVIGQLLSSLASINATVKSSTGELDTMGDEFDRMISVIDETVASVGSFKGMTEDDLAEVRRRAKAEASETAMEDLRSSIPDFREIENEIDLQLNGDFELEMSRAIENGLLGDENQVPAETPEHREEASHG